MKDYEISEAKRFKYLGSVLQANGDFDQCFLNFPSGGPLRDRKNTCGPLNKNKNSN